MTTPCVETSLRLSAKLEAPLLTAGVIILTQELVAPLAV